MQQRNSEDSNVPEILGICVQSWFGTFIVQTFFIRHWICMFAIGSTVNKKLFHGRNEEIYSAFGEICCTKWRLCGTIIMYINSWPSQSYKGLLNIGKFWWHIRKGYNSSHLCKYECVDSPISYIFCLPIRHVSISELMLVYVKLLKSAVEKRTA